MQRRIFFYGPFTDEDLKLLADTVRQIERKNPEAVFKMLVDSDTDEPAQELKMAQRYLLPQ